MSRAVLVLNSPDVRARAKSCAQCGATFSKDPRNTWSYWEKAKYCSQACAGSAHAAASEAARLPLDTSFSRWVDRGCGEGCWEWRGARDKDGYGVFNHGGRTHRAHRVAVEIAGKRVPKGAFVCHHCDNPACVNPAHLYIGTHLQNVGDKVQRGRQHRGSGHPASRLTEADIREIRTASGTHAAIAKRFGVSPATVTLVINRKTWGHVE